jgi:hypothetical protein
MLKFLGYTVISVAFLSSVMIAGQLYLMRMELQSAFDRSAHIAVDQTLNQRTPDLPIDATIAEAIFLEMIQYNLGLADDLAATSFDQKIKSVDIHDLQVFNVFSPTLVSVTNPLNHQVLTRTISRPSVLVLAVVRVDTGYLPFFIPIPIFSVSSGYAPD